MEVPPEEADPNSRLRWRSWDIPYSPVIEADRTTVHRRAVSRWTANASCRTRVNLQGLSGGAQLYQ